MTQNIPENLKYTKDHEWVEIADNNFFTMGITDFAQSALGDIVFVELPEIGTKIEKGQSFGVVESVKSVSDIYAPLSGEVIEINEELNDSPELCNSNPYHSWLIKVKLTDQSELNELIDSEGYQELCHQAS